MYSLYVVKATAASYSVNGVVSLTRTVVIPPDTILGLPKGGAGAAGGSGAVGRPTGRGIPRGAGG